MSDPARLEALHQHDLFLAEPSPTALLDGDLVLRAANPAYLAATESREDELLSRPMFEVFPDNPASPEARAVADLTASLERVLQTGQRDHMGVQRYDVPDRGEADTFLARTWVAQNIPLWRDGQLVGVMHRVDDVTSLVPDSSTDEIDQHQLGATLTSLMSLSSENRQLGAALTSRATIDQAKGMVMRHCRCDADEAFARLATISSHTQVRVATIAAALTQQTPDGDDVAEEILTLAASFAREDLSLRKR